MKHYICTGGCEGVSEKQGVCQDETCPKHGQPLTECDCVDGGHGKEIPAEPDADAEERGA